MPRLLCFILGSAVLYAGFSHAQDAIKVTGVVKKMDAKTGAITIRPTRKGATEDESYSLLKKEIEVTTVGGEKTKLDIVAPGQTVQLKIGASGDVEAIMVQPYVFLAKIVDVDAKKRTVVLAREETPTSTLPVSAEAKILLAGRNAFLREVKPESQMTVTVSLDGKMVQGMNLVSDPEGKLANKLYTRVKTSKLPGTRWVGVLSDIDVAKGEVNLTGPKTKGIPKPMTVAKNVLIQVMHGQVPVQSVQLNQLAKTNQATIIVSNDNQQITRILIDPPTASAKVKSLDDNGGELTVDLNGTVRTFALRAGLKVMNGTRVMRLEDLQPKRAVSLVLSLDREQLLAVDLR